jgi:hypothetical protein
MSSISMSNNNNSNNNTTPTTPTPPFPMVPTRTGAVRPPIPKQQNQSSPRD